MAVLLQINEIVSGPIKDLLVHISGGNFPEIKLPNISLPEVNLPELPPMSSPTYPEEVNLEVGGSSFGDLGSSNFLNETGSSELLNDFQSSELDLSALGSVLGGYPLRCWQFRLKELRIRTPSPMLGQAMFICVPSALLQWN